MYVPLAVSGLSGYRRRGLGDASSVASTAVGGAISAGVALASTAASLWLNSIQLSHTADTATTQIVNGLAPLLQANVTAYLNGPGTCADQAAAMAAYLTAVQWLLSTAGCGNGAYGSAGNACISDRFGPGGATDANAKYPWAAYYYYPIANDPRASGCAAQLASDNPNAAEESALQNIANLTTGSTMQTTAGNYDTTTGSIVPASSSAGAAPAATSILSGTFLGLPVWAWAAGGVGLFIAMK